MHLIADTTDLCVQSLSGTLWSPCFDPSVQNAVRPEWRSKYNSVCSSC